MTKKLTDQGTLTRAYLDWLDTGVDHVFNYVFHLTGCRRFYKDPIPWIFD